MEIAWRTERSPRTSSVEPPPMSTHRSGNRPAESGDGARKGEGSLLGALDDLGLDPEDRTDGVDELVAVLRVPRGGSRDEADGGRAEPADHPLVLDDGVDGAVDGGRIEAPRAIDPLTEADDPHLTGEVGEARPSVGAGLGVGDEESDGVRSAIDGSYSSHPMILPQARAPAPGRTARRGRGMSQDRRAIRRVSRCSGPGSRGRARP